MHIGLRRSLVTLGIAAITLVVAVSCQPQSDRSTDRIAVEQTPPMPSGDHHPPPRSPQN